MEARSIAAEAIDKVPVGVEFIIAAIKNSRSDEELPEDPAFAQWREIRSIENAAVEAANAEIGPQIEEIQRKLDALYRGGVLAYDI